MRVCYGKTLLVVFGICAAVLIVETGMRLAGFLIQASQDRRNRLSIGKKDTYRIICIGESTTRNAYPSLFEEALNRRCPGRSFSVIDKGRDGTNTPTILSQIGSYLDENRPAMVVAMIGINDWGRHLPYESPTASKTIRFLRSLKTYRLSRFLWMHARATMQEVFRKKSKEGPPVQIDSGALRPAPERVEAPVQGGTSVVSPGSISRESQEYTRLGCQYRIKGDVKQAGEYYRKAVESSPANSEALAGLGWAYRVQGELTKALQYLEQAIQLDPKNEGAYCELGRLRRAEGKAALAEQAFARALELNPKNDWTYVELGRLFHDQGLVAKADESFHKAIALYPGNTYAYFELGRLYRDAGDLGQAKEYLRQVIARDPAHFDAYIELGRIYRDEGDAQQARVSLQQAVQLDPGSTVVNVELGRICRSEKDLVSAEGYFRKELEMRPGNEEAYAEMGRVLYAKGKVSEAGDYYRRALEIEPGNVWACLELSQLYRFEGNLVLAEEYLQRGIRANPANDKLYAGLASIYEERGDRENARLCYERANQLWQEKYNSITQRNLRRLKQILDARKIVFVCVQYPMRDVEPLTRMFDDRRGIVFVDNKKSFKEAVRKEGYKAYFSDMFAGDFGHCTDKGNRLLAENIATVILREVFGK